MTTIVYHEGYIACDGMSRCQSSNQVLSADFQKWYDVGDWGIMFGAGGVADLIYLAALLRDGESIPDGFDLELEAILVRNGEVFAVDIKGKTITPYPLRRRNECLGSGQQFAFAALDLIPNCTARQAVEYASTRDCGTGGKITVYDVKKGEFVDE